MHLRKQLVILFWSTILLNIFKLIFRLRSRHPGQIKRAAVYPLLLFSIHYQLFAKGLFQLAGGISFGVLGLRHDRAHTKELGDLVIIFSVDTHAGRFHFINQLGTIVDNEIGQYMLIIRWLASVDRNRHKSLLRGPLQRVYPYTDPAV